jgi:hypothetical protein
MNYLEAIGSLGLLGQSLRPQVRDDQMLVGLADLVHERIELRADVRSFFACADRRFAERHGFSTRAILGLARRHRGLTRAQSLFA